MRTFLLVPAIIMVAACQPAKTAVTVDKAWIRLTPVAGNPSAAYFTLRGGTKDETLTGVAAPDAMRATMHESTSSASIERMTELKLVAVRAGSSVAFAPGGKHVMLYGLKARVTPGTSTPLTFTFASGQTMTVSAKVVGAGDSAPGE